MTKKELEKIIEATANKYGFEIEENLGGFWSSKQNSDSYMRVDIFNQMDNEKSDFNNAVLWFNVEPLGCVCQMGERTNAEELLRASQEIERGAKFVAEIKAMNLSYKVEATKKTAKK